MQQPPSSNPKGSHLPNLSFMPARPQGADYHHASQILLTPEASLLIDKAGALSYGRCMLGQGSVQSDSAGRYLNLNAYTEKRFSPAEHAEHVAASAQVLRILREMWPFQWTHW